MYPKPFQVGIGSTLQLAVFCNLHHLFVCPSQDDAYGFRLVFGDLAVQPCIVNAVLYGIRPFFHSIWVC